MGRRLLVLVALAACALLVLLLRREAAPPRAPPRRGLLEGESLKDLPDLPKQALPEREPTFLTGHVYGPDGSPVLRAEVRVVYPKTFDLVRSGEDGAYELPFDRHGRFLIEAALTIELAPERAWAEIPEFGDPAPLDFHLKPAGAIFGEVTLAGVPVEDAGVEVYVTDIFGDEELVYDTSARNGYFNFYFDPPKDAPLRIDVKSTEGLLRTPLRFQWHGEQVNAGRFDLTPYPSLRIRMRLPDGTYAPDVLTCRPEDLEFFQVWYVARRSLGTGSRVCVPSEEDVTMRLVFVATIPPTAAEPLERPPYMVEREVQLLFGRPRELEVIVRPGPFVVASRLVDDRGRGVPARLRCVDSEATTREDGTFQITVPHGGLHTITLAALDVAGIGWVELAPNVAEHALLLDADNPAECRLELGGRILLRATQPFAFCAGRGEDKVDWYEAGEEVSGGASLSPRLEPGSYHWNWDNLGGWQRTGDVRVEADRMAIVDLR